VWVRLLVSLFLCLLLGNAVVDNWLNFYSRYMLMKVVRDSWCLWSSNWSLLDWCCWHFFDLFLGLRSWGWLLLCFNIRCL
jgi:hypothetical protein